MSFYGKYNGMGGGGGGGVSSLDGLTGALTLVAGTGISITDGATTITIASTSSGDVTLTPVGSSPNADGASLSGQALTLQPANTSFPGVLLAVDWNTFNSKQNALTFGNLTDVGTDGIVVTNGTGAVIGTGTSIAQHVADTTHNGYLSSTDWNTFNSKQAAGNYITALTGDVTATGPGSVPSTVAKIQGTTVSGTTGTGNVAFSASPTFTGTLSASAVSLSAALNMNSHLINSVTDPVSAQDAATKAYVDAGLAALQPQASVYAATTANIAGTYLNGVAGVGATFTTTATGTFTVDGVTPPISSRILIKNQSSGFQNGIYFISTLGTVGVSTIFTRTLDYDTAADMNNAGLIPVINGTANALSSWQQVATITTVGTDALVFTEFTANPSLYLLKANNLNDVASASTSFNNISPITLTGDLIVGNGVSSNTRLGIGSTGNVLTVSGGTATWAPPATSGTVTSVSVVSTNGFAGTVATATTTPAITISTTITGILQGNGTAISAATTTGSGSVVLATSPTLTTPALGTPSALVGTNITGTGSGFTAGKATAPASGSAHGAVVLDSSGNFTTVAPGTSGHVLQSNGTDWTSAANAPVANYTAQTTGYTAVAGDYVNFTSGTENATLPTAVGVAGQSITLLNTGTGIITILTTSSQTIGGYASGVLKLAASQNELGTFTSDGANWQISAHTYKTTWVSFTPTFTGFGTPTSVNCYWKREGANQQLKLRFSTGTNTAVAAAVTLPVGTVDNTSMSSTSIVGTGVQDTTGTLGYDFNVLATGNGTLVNFSLTGDGSVSNLSAANANHVFNNATAVSFFASVPITDWW